MKPEDEPEDELDGAFSAVLTIFGLGLAIVMLFGVLSKFLIVLGAILLLIKFIFWFGYPLSEPASFTVKQYWTLGQTIIIWESIIAGVALACGVWAASLYWQPFSGKVFGLVFYRITIRATIRCCGFVNV
jgi:hypothetical protein